MRPNRTKDARRNAISMLAERVKPGDEVVTVLRNVSSSGMSRAIDVYRLECVDGKIQKLWLTGNVYLAGIGSRWSERFDCLTISGAGMDMGFEIVYELGRTLFADGFDCIGEGCPANDHANGLREYGPGIEHKDGGYAFRQVWL